MTGLPGAYDLLDLFCGPGGAARGYQLAGFRVTGVDISPQPHYGGDQFVQADAMEVLGRIASGRPAWPGAPRFAAMHLSPPCQFKARVTAWRGSREDHPDLLTPSLALLADVRIPWVVENVPEACPPLQPHYLLCGTNFGLKVRRHRAFQRGNWSGFELLPPCSCHRNPRLLPFEHKNERAFADAMGCTWMPKEAARQAVPPAMTEFLGLQMLEHLRGLAA